jgi:hypothetical protein
MNTKFYETYTDEQLAAMQKVFYSGKANKWQAEKFQLIHAGLLAELRQFNPSARDGSSLCYMRAAIGSCLYDRRQEEKAEAARMRAAAQSAHTQLKAWEWEGLK